MSHPGKDIMTLALRSADITGAKYDRRFPLVSGTTQILVPTSIPFTVIEDAPEEMTTLDDVVSDHSDRESSSCFAATAYVQRTNMTAGVFT
jgi:hypothetical protein